jgi:hypothetical protein
MSERGKHVSLQLDDITLARAKLNGNESISELSPDQLLRVIALCAISGRYQDTTHSHMRGLQNDRPDAKQTRDCLLRAKRVVKEEQGFGNDRKLTLSYIDTSEGEKVTLVVAIGHVRGPVTVISKWKNPL